MVSDRILQGEKIVGGDKVHSKLGASSSERWFECPGSVALCEIAPKRGDTDYSIEGTNAHTLFETCMNRREAVSYWIGREKEIGLDFKVTQEMAGYVQAFIDRCRWELFQLPGAVMYVEKQFHLKHIHPLLFGTADVVIVQPFGKIKVIDFKYGAGVAVDVIENSQLLYYGLGASHGEDFGEITLVVAQPRIEGSEWQEWETTPEYMIEFSKTLKAKAIATEKKDAPLNPGEWCRWCNAASICPALQKKALLAAQTDFAEEGEPKLPEIKRMTEEQMVRVIQYKKTLNSWIDAVEETMFLKLMSGQKVPGLKLVRGKSKREWNDEAALKVALGDQVKNIMTQPKLMTPAQAEKVFGKNKLGAFISTIQGGLQVAHEDDKRAEVTNAQDDFKELEAPNEPKVELSEYDF